MYHASQFKIWPNGKNTRRTTRVQSDEGSLLLPTSKIADCHTEIAFMNVLLSKL